MQQRVVRWAAMAAAAVISLWTMQLAQSQGDGQSIADDNFQALIAIKAALLDPYGALASWNTSALSGACSGSWEGIKCWQGKVVALQLPGRGLGGSIPDEVGQLRDLTKLNLKSNSIAGSIPQPLARLQKLRSLYLSSNLFSGGIPMELGVNSTGLQSVDLSQNQLVGSIPWCLITSTKLMLLNLSFNHLTGSLPLQWPKSLSLIALDVSHNSLGGSLPTSWGAGSQLHYFDASYNLLTGTIPPSVSPLIKLKHLKLQHNLINGSMPSELGQLMGLERLQLSDNALGGSIPSEIGHLSRLSGLDLSHNQLIGVLPSSLGSLESLRDLNVSGNMLAGAIPSGLADLPLLASLDLSFNHLSGSIPAFKQKFNLSSFEGNSGLCVSSSACSPSFVPSVYNSAGSPPHHRQQQQQQQRHHSSHLGIVTILCIGISSALAVSTAACMVMFLLWRSAHLKQQTKSAHDEEKVEEPQAQSSEAAAAAGKLVLLEGCVQFTAHDLLRATAEVMGKTSYGTDYKATLEGGSALIVKRLREGIVKTQGEFEREVNRLGRIRHPNLLPLRAYYWGPKNEKLLLFDHMPAGSLAAFLHDAARGPEKAVGWSIRAAIAAGAARGLHSLHEQENMIHGNLTSSIILLDSNLNAKIFEYGLAGLMMGSAESSNLVSTPRNLGYRAPELARFNQPTTQSDVYSFGIVLLELLTGKAPGETTSPDGGVLDLPDFVSSVKEEEDWTAKVFDAELIQNSEASAEADLLNTLQLALRCVALSPTSRPDMTQVMDHLEGVSQ